MSVKARPAEAVRTALARAQAYGLLASAFGRPDPDLESALASGHFRQVLEEALAALGCDETLSLVTELDGWESGGLSADFMRLFNPSVDANLPPYETEYTGAHVFQRTQQLADVAGFYRAFGLRIASSFHERPDHIAAELEFMQVLALKEARALARGERGHVRVCRRAQARFLKEHLGRWLATYAERMSTLRDGFYARLASLASSFVAWDAKRLGLEPQMAAPPLATQPEPDMTCPEPPADVEGPVLSEVEGSCPASGGEADVSC